MQPEQVRNLKCQNLRTLGAIAVIFNSHASTKTLQLSQQALVGIFSCTVTHWNDTLIQSSNPSITLPYSPIIPLHFNSVPSSQTFVFSDALCEFSGQWCDQYGVGSNITWFVNFHEISLKIGVRTKIKTSQTILKCWRLFKQFRLALVRFNYSTTHQ